MRHCVNTLLVDTLLPKQVQQEKVLDFYQRVLTDLGHIHAVLGRGVVAAGSDGRHIHAVQLPDGGVMRVKVAAVGARRHIVGTLMSRPFAVMKERRKRRHMLTDANVPHRWWCLVLDICM